MRGDADMYDLDTLLQGAAGRWVSGLPVRLALVSRSYRSTGTRRGQDNKAFGSRFPPLSLLNIAAALREDAPGLRRQVDLRVFDEEDHADVAALGEAVTRWLDVWDGPTAIGVTAYTYNIAELEAFLSGFDAARHLIVAGGPHVTTQPWMRHAHLLVRGEGRRGVAHIVDALGLPGFAHDTTGTGLVFDLAGTTVRQRPAFDDSLRTLASPPFAYDLVSASRERFTTHVERALSARPQIYLCTQSCRARCSFCSTYLVHGPFKSRLAHLVAQDLRYLVEVQGHDGFEFLG
jgi:anaerobic magnesium-protoporphyrin IX monomethyl ester cyclase